MVSSSSPDPLSRGRPELTPSGSDYNYEMDSTHFCHLAKGLEPQSKEEWCRDHPDETDYYKPTGFRRIPLSTCEDGDEYDKLGEPEWCPGREDEFLRKHRGPGGASVFFAVTLPIGLAAAVGWYVYRNWTGKFGTIRLGDGAGAGGGRGLLDSDAPWVKYPVIALSAAVALVGAIPLVAAALWRTAAGAAERWGFGSGRGAWSRVGGGGGAGTRPFTTRDSFARGRGDYDAVDEDEGELLGDDSDEEV